MGQKLIEKIGLLKQSIAGVKQEIFVRDWMSVTYLFHMRELISSMTGSRVIMLVEECRALTEVAPLSQRTNDKSSRRSKNREINLTN
ncbi:hypothetical protein PSI23_07385 [Xenorhabdus sp. XENO-10]|uniref:Uncharacterized protein n=1 Tax=Xenorhabdus yunnanensis TaxID=3025878 RepID=A0ABT5LDG5_9GAMM|nr:hypothetical protein [Xenorhabdus yunnanensis]MDC9589148.1 hypothetical protein [Xenorhabdus yunnanensis]